MTSIHAWALALAAILLLGCEEPASPTVPTSAPEPVAEREPRPGTPPLLVEKGTASLPEASVPCLTQVELTCADLDELELYQGVPAEVRYHDEPIRLLVPASDYRAPWACGGRIHIGVRPEPSTDPATLIFCGSTSWGAGLDWQREAPESCLAMPPILEMF